MLRLVEKLDSVSVDWSDHAMWWPEKNTWLLRTNSTLDQCHVMADSKLWFTPMHKTLRVQLPDMQLLDLSVNFSCKVFNAVQDLCKDLGIRHPEELSFLRRPQEKSLKPNGRDTQKKKRGDRDRDSMASSNSADLASTGSLDGIPPHSPTPYNKSRSGTTTPGTPGSNSSFPGHNGTAVSIYSTGSSYSDGSCEGLNTSLTNSPQVPSREALDGLVKPKSFRDKAIINKGWLDSSKSLMEQGLRDNDTLMMRYKYFSFYDLDPKQDAVRINQIYEQAKWGLLTEEIDCTEEEMVMFAALQLQINLQSILPQTDMNTKNGKDDIDADLLDLEKTLQGTNISSYSHHDITNVPELKDEFKYLRPKKLTLKGYKKGFFTFRDIHLTQYKSKEDMPHSPLHKHSLKGCEVTPDVNIANSKFGIKLLVASAEGMQELCLKCDNENQYARWMAACRLASKGKTMADSTYDTEVQGIQAFLKMQQHKPSNAPTINPDAVDIQPESYIAPRFLKKLKPKQIATRILEAHANVREMSLMDARWNYIKAWQALPEYGITYFVVRFRNSKKEDLLGIAYNRVIRMDINTGESQKNWRYSTMTAWHVNWEVREVTIQTEDEDIHFQSQSADCKVVHEFIGGYIFLSMRSKDQNQTLNEELFHKLTGGWV
ncbi:fermitin family homolog 2-like [Anneissia japonica]|uniref:fermitin family homolog 2-like n=1 Tax=Anneissia japonica TaxID=1529436 RepID=UPI0014258195|nr:fermitin family homolog 2-like [Anneissia japonica]